MQMKSVLLEALNCIASSPHVKLLSSWKAILYSSQGQISWFEFLKPIPCSTIPKCLTYLATWCDYSTSYKWWKCDFFYNDCLDWLDVDHFEVVEKTTLNEILGHFHLSSLLHKLQMMKPSFITTDILTLDWPILKPCDTLIAYLFSLHSMAGTLLVTLYIQIVCLNELLIRQHNRQLFIKE